MENQDSETYTPSKRDEEGILHFQRKLIDAKKDE